MIRLSVWYGQKGYKTNHKPGKNTAKFSWRCRGMHVATTSESQEFRHHRTGKRRTQRKLEQPRSRLWRLGIAGHSLCSKGGKHVVVQCRGGSAPYHELLTVCTVLSGVCQPDVQDDQGRGTRPTNTITYSLMSILFRSNAETDSTPKGVLA